MMQFKSLALVLFGCGCVSLGAAMACEVPIRGAVDARQGETVQGSVVMKTLILPESNENGYVEIIVRDEKTGKPFCFLEEDSAGCSLLGSGFGCTRAARRDKFKTINFGNVVRLTQKKTRWWATFDPSRPWIKVSRPRI